MKRLGIFLLPFLCWFFLVAAVPLWAAESPRYGGRFVFGIAKDVTSLNPFWRTQSTDKYVREMMYETLLDFDAKGRMVPWLAESWEVSPDGKTYTFKLRKGVRFHNGKELTAEDVKWSVDYALDPKNAATGLSVLTTVAAVNAKDNLTVQFVLRQIDPVFIIQVASIHAFVVVPKESVPTAQNRLPAFPPGTGPFVFQAYKRAGEITFTRNKNYWQRGLPYLDEVVLKPVEDDQTRFASVRAGDLDMVERIPYAFVKKLQAGEFPQLTTAEAKYSGFRRLVFNVAEAPFNNVKLRHAVRYSLDIPQFLQLAYWGFGEPARAWGISKESPWYSELPEIRRDVSKVKQLLKEAGAGSDLEVVIIARRGEEEENQIIQQQMSSAGIKTRIEFLEHAPYVTRRREGKYMMVLSGADQVRDPGDAYPYRFGCDEVKKGQGRIGNYSAYCNEEFERLIDEAGKIIDQKRRYDLYAKAIRMIHDDAPEIPFIFVPRFFALNKKFKGFVTDWDGRFNMSTGGLSRMWQGE